MNNTSSWSTDPRECHNLLDQLNQQVEDLQAALNESAKIRNQTIREHDQLIDQLRRQSLAPPPLYLWTAAETLGRSPRTGTPVRLERGHEHPPAP